jgi:hypothetical protein
MEKRVKDTAAAGFAILTGLLALPVIVAQSGAIINSVAGCEGVERFYTGAGFWKDRTELILGTENSGGYNYSTSVIEHYQPIPPKEFGNGYKYDCKSITNALFCLSRFYGLKCRFESTVRMNSDFTFGPGHVGLYCWNGTRSEWVMVY